MATVVWLRWAAASLGLVGSLCLAQTNKPVINWMLWDFAPGTISANGQPIDGYVYNNTRTLLDAWPEAQHTFTLSTIDNAIASLNRGVEACYASALLTPERERTYYLTQTLVVAPHSVIVRSEVAAKLPKNEKGEVLAGQLFDRKDLRGVLAQNRSYSALLDALINSRSANSGLTKIKQAAGANNILQMLVHGRADYTIEYAVPVLYQEQQLPAAAQGQIKILPLAGLQPIPVGIACPRTDWGREVITKADALLSKLVMRPDYFDALQRWHPESIKKYMEPHFKAFRKQRSLPPDTKKYPPP